MLLSWKVADDWAVLGGGLVNSAGEGGADFGDTITAGAVAGFVYHSSPNLQVGAIVGAVSAIEDNAAVVPLPILDWRRAIFVIPSNDSAFDGFQRLGPARWTFDRRRRAGLLRS